MEKEVTGCADCIFCNEYDMGCGYGCALDGNLEVKQSKKYQPIDPEGCPLKKEAITISLKK